MVLGKQVVFGGKENITFRPERGIAISNTFPLDINTSFIPTSYKEMRKEDTGPYDGLNVKVAKRNVCLESSIGTALLTFNQKVTMPKFTVEEVYLFHPNFCISRLNENNRS